MTAIVIFLEVMDKEPSLTTIWLTALVVGIGGFLLCFFRHLLIWLVFPISIFLAMLLVFAIWSEVHDPYVGPAIIAEAGYNYMIQTYLAAMVMVVTPCLGALLKFRKRNFSQARIAS